MAKAKTHVTDLRHFLTKDGAIASMTKAAERLAEFLGGIVVHATTSRKPSEPVNCRVREGLKRCPGEIETGFDRKTAAVVWLCPVCGEKGMIWNWEGTLWDHRNDSIPH